MSLGAFLQMLLPPKVSLDGSSGFARTEAGARDCSIGLLSLLDLLAVAGVMQLYTSFAAVVPNIGETNMCIGVCGIATDLMLFAPVSGYRIC